MSLITASPGGTTVSADSEIRLAGVDAQNLVPWSIFVGQEVEIVAVNYDFRHPVGKIRDLTPRRIRLADRVHRRDVISAVGRNAPVQNADGVA